MSDDEEYEEYEENFFDNEWNVSDRTSLYNYENKNLSDEERIEKTIHNIMSVLKLYSETQKNIITKIYNINNIKYKNPYGIVFGYLVSQTKDNFKDIIIQFNEFKKNSEFEIYVTEIDILRYSRLWEKYK